MGEGNETLEGKLVESIEAKKLGDLTVEYAELGLDDILNDGIIKDIPFLRTAVSLAKIGFNVRDRIYVKKVVGFLAQFSQTTQEQRSEFVEKNCGNVKRFEEAVMLILEQADRFEKTSLIGKIFKACILGMITYQDALSLSFIVNKALWQDLQAMFTGDYTDENQIRLAYSCLMNMNIKRLLAGGVGGSTPTADTYRFTPNSYANMLIEIAKME